MIQAKVFNTFSLHKSLVKPGVPLRKGASDESHELACGKGFFSTWQLY